MDGMPFNPVTKDDIMTDLRKALIKLAHDVPALRQHLIPILKVARNTVLEFHRSGDGFYVKDPSDKYGQTYDSYIIHHQNPKKVFALAQQAMEDWRRANHGSNDSSDLMDFINNYVKEKTNGRWDYVRWNMKSYPD
jgi:hypothetical protein